MTKREILEYAKENYELPDIPNEYLEDTSFVVSLLEIDTSFMDEFPLEVQKNVIIAEDKFAKYANLDLIFADEETARECVTANPDLLLCICGCEVHKDFFAEQIRGYICGELQAPPGTNLSRADVGVIYSKAPKYIIEDVEIAKIVIEKNINNYKKIRLPEIRDNKEYMAKYVTANPKEFSAFKDKLGEYLPDSLIEAVIKKDFSNYKHFPKDNPVMQRFYTSFERIKEVRPELTLENPNLRWEVLCDPAFTDMDVNILNSLLEYNTGAVDKVIVINKQGELQLLQQYIEKYKSVYGATLPNIQGAIKSFESVRELAVSTEGLQGIDVPEDVFKTIVATENKFGIQTLEELENFEEVARAYYEEEIAKAKTSEEIREIYANMLFNASQADIQEFNEEYCNFNMDELYEYAKAHNVEAPLTEDFRRRIELLEQIECITDIEELREKFASMPLVISDLDETKQKISGMYSKTYNQDMLDLTDETLERETVDGVEVIKLNGQSFNLCIHRIFNFDFNMNSIANRIIEDPTLWAKTEGSNTISTTLITDKKIAALFRGLKKENEAEFVLLESDEAVKQYVEEGKAKELAVYEGEVLTEIDQTAVFYGFTELAEEGIIKMDSTDMMTEHGGGHLDTKTKNCRMRGMEDLAYWTSPAYWNEVVQKRKETNIAKAEERMRKTGTDKLMPSCIICFDGNINENSMRAAKVHGIPVVMIDRQLYLDLNTERANEARKEFRETLSPDSIREIMYREPYYKVVAEMPSLIETITSNETLPESKKKLALEYLGYMAEHFVEQSTGGIMGVPVEEYNKTMRNHIESIDRCIQGQDLVSVEDFAEAYRETSARDRRARYEAMLKDMDKDKTKEGENIYE